MSNFSARCTSRFGNAFVTLALLCGCIPGDISGIPVGAGGSATDGPQGGQAGTTGGRSGNSGSSGSGTGGMSGGTAGAGTAGAGTAGTSGTGQAGGGGSGPIVPPSCASEGDGVSDCGLQMDGDCCATLDVPGGDFFRGYDGVALTDKTHPATVSDFRLDKYEVTVGRFRRFVEVWNNGWRPTSGSGTHFHLAHGRGVADAASGKYEFGWDETWAEQIPTNLDDWEAAIHDPRCDWSTEPGEKELYPIGCVTWFEAYAFCIWDGGFLPTGAERNYASAGGEEQRIYPWSETTPADWWSLIDTSHAVFCGVGCDEGPCGGSCNSDVQGPSFVGSTLPAGAGKWGHADLAGNEWDWLLDGDTPLTESCINCAAVGSQTNFRTYGGGSYIDVPWNLLSGIMYGANPAGERYINHGIRCARPPADACASKATCPPGQSCSALVHGIPRCQPIDYSASPLGVDCDSPGYCKTQMCFALQCSEFCTTSEDCGQGNACSVNQDGLARCSRVCEADWHCNTDQCSFEDDPISSTPHLICTVPNTDAVGFGEKVDLSQGKFCYSHLLWSPVSGGETLCTRACRESSDCDAPLPTCQSAEQVSPLGFTQSIMVCGTLQLILRPIPEALRFINALCRRRFLEPG